ncbi:putative metalloprotease CJM1_0395 family protein [Marinobacter bryozoorum]|uniref:putative metalloprotease CJM1_0395 family protein n=1 Tax=Marinobacter bryozoorum TaxID=256324 RepID=UPI0020050EF5|nr:putative metalloprotease CJM1_0395 family protein [Marinobacter bryozoorum]
MAISSALPSISPITVPPTTGRGPVPPVSDSDSRGISESRNPETPRATDQAAETRGERGEKNGKAEGERSNGEARAGQSLDEAQLKQLRDLKARDREVRAHEQAHQAVGGQYAGSVSYTYQRGPDGNQYAVGGEVSIDLSPVEGDPQATIEKMRQVRAAAMAPAQPSGQDRAVAAQAMQLMLQAQSEVALEGQPSGREVPESDTSQTDQGDTAATDSIDASNTYRTIASMARPDRANPGFTAVA